MGFGAVKTKVFNILGNVHEMFQEFMAFTDLAAKRAGFFLFQGGEVAELMVGCNDVTKRVGLEHF